MKSKEEMIEVMGEAIRNNVKFGDFWDKNDSEVLAEAALKALCGALPEHYERDFAANNYTQLKQWGK